MLANLMIEKNYEQLKSAGAILTNVESTVGLPLMMMMMSSRLTNMIINKTLTLVTLRGRQKDCTSWYTVCLPRIVCHLARSLKPNDVVRCSYCVT